MNEGRPTGGAALWRLACAPYHDGSLVAVMYNSGAAKNYTVAIGGKNLQFAMPGSGWATVKFVK